jgi:hypothetical protein
VVFSYLRDDFSEDDDHGLQRKKSPSAPQPPRCMLEREISQLTVETRTAAIPPPRTLSRKIGSDSLTIYIASHHTFAPTSQITSLPSKSKSSDEHAKQTIEKPASTCTYDVAQQQDDQDPMSPTLEQLEDFRGVLLFGRVRGRLGEDSEVHVV